jgi:predicted aspartyl protease
LILVEAEVVGPTGRTTETRLVLDTGAAATTLTPRVIEKIGYNQRDGFKKAKVHTAIGQEHGYWLRVAELTVLGVTTPNFALTVFPLGHKDIDGLVGMNFLRPARGLGAPCSVDSGTQRRRARQQARERSSDPIEHLAVRQGECEYGAAGGVDLERAGELVAHQRRDWRLASGGQQLAEQPDDGRDELTAGLGDPLPALAVLRPLHALCALALVDRRLVQADRGQERARRASRRLLQGGVTYDDPAGQDR